ncbi:MAG: response regulator transcription factor [Anaerolineae bacterium]
MTKILVVEDDRDIRELIAFTLRFAGMEVETASGGPEGIEKARKAKPDLILLDVRMPRMNGFEACQRLKEDEQTRDIPVVFLSARGQESEIQQGLSAGAVGYILKPFSPDQLPRQVQEILARGKGRDPA